MTQRRRQSKAALLRKALQTITQPRDYFFISILVLGFGLPALLLCLLLLVPPVDPIATIASLSILLFYGVKIWQRLQEHKSRMAAMDAQSKASLETSYQVALARVDAFHEGFMVGLEAAGVVIPPIDESVELDADSLTLLDQFQAGIEARFEATQKFLGDSDCNYSARSPNVRWAINPIGPCEGCP